MGIVVRNSLNLGALKDRAAGASPDALQAAADHVKDVAAGNAPLLSGPEELKKANDERRTHPGALRESAYARVLDEDRAEVGFSEFYARWQHERLDYHHTDGHAKFLEQAIDTESDEALRIMADKLAEGIHG